MENKEDRFKKTKRDTGFFFRISNDELSIIKNKAKKQGITVTRFLVTLALNKNITAKADEKMLLNMQKIGVNLNQMAHIANSNRDLPALDLIRTTLNNYQKEFEEMKRILQKTN